jgi:hypothetical protein
MGRKQGEHDPYQPDAPGWYADPWSATGTGERYFDGKQWGTNERPRGRHSTTAATTTGAATVTRLRPGRRRAGGLVARFRIPIILVLIGAAATGLYVLQESQRSGPSTVSGGDPSIGTQRPAPGAEEAARRLEPALPPVTGAGGFEFQNTQPGHPDVPVAWDPCRPVHWVDNPAGAPADGLEAVKSAFTELARATGLRFVYDGVTDETPARDRAAYQPDRYDGSRWAPVLVAWSDEDDFRELIGHVTGVTQPARIALADGRSVYVSGSVVLDAVDLSAAHLPFREVMRATVRHELGHLVGLDHTTDRTQLMYSETQPGVFDYGTGDRHGLALEGSQACFPEV